MKVYPDYSLEVSLNYLWNNHLSILLKTLEKNKIDERSIGTNKIEILSEMLQNKDIVTTFFFYIIHYVDNFKN